MTATAAVAPAAAPRAAATSEPRDASSSPGQFDRQLDAARQKQSPPQDDTAKKTPAPEVTADTKAATDAGASTANTANAPASHKPADDDAPMEGDTAASALASAMLALLGPAATTLRPLAAGVANAVARPAGKTAAGDAGAAALLKINTAAAGTAASAATSTAAALPAGTGIMLAADDAKLALADKAGDASTAPTATLAPPTAGPNTAPATVHQLQIPTPVGSHGFAQELGQQVAWLGGQDVKQARIRLHPEDMGQLDIKVSVHHSRVDVVFNAQHPGAAAAVQQSLPQLDQMLAQHGLSLGHAEVGHQDRGSHGGGEQNASDSAAIDEVGEIHGVAASTGSVSLLDAFA